MVLQTAVSIKNVLLDAKSSSFVRQLNMVIEFKRDLIFWPTL